MSDSELKNDENWRNTLTEEEFRICREKGTEPAFSGKYWEAKSEGSYVCRCCKQPLFDSSSKYDSGSGWPSFYQAVEKGAIKEIVDRTLTMIRTEIVCNKCACHLGHVFTDGPQPTGLRYCVNSASIDLKPESKT